MADFQWVLGDGCDQQFAWLENGEGRNVVCIERLAGRTADGSLTFAGPSVHRYDALDHATTDEQWQSIVDCISAAPEMVATLKNLRHMMQRGGYSVDSPVEQWVRMIDATLAKAEPVRTERRKVRVQVDIEVDVPRGEALDCDLIVKKVQDRVFNGMHDHGEFDRDTTTVKARAVKVGDLD